MAVIKWAVDGLLSERGPRDTMRRWFEDAQRDVYASAILKGTDEDGGDYVFMLCVGRKGVVKLGLVCPNDDELVLMLDAANTCRVVTRVPTPETMRAMWEALCNKTTLPVVLGALSDLGVRTLPTAGEIRRSFVRLAPARQEMQAVALAAWQVAAQHGVAWRRAYALTLAYRVRVW
jgi:hypothetical protein